MATVVDIMLLAGAIAWITTATVSKSGPFSILTRWRHWVRNRLGDNTPFECFHCASFWIGIVAITLYYADPVVFRPLIQLFGFLGIAQALRGASGEWI